MLTDTTPLIKLGRLIVLAARHDIEFRDDDIVTIHPVLVDGVPCNHQRCWVHDGLNALVFDVRDLASSLAAELPSCPARDTQGLIAMPMRLKYRHGREFTAAVIANFRAAGLLPVEPVQRPLNLIFSTGHAHALGDGSDDRRFWPVPMEGLAT